MSNQHKMPEEEKKQILGASYNESKDSVDWNYYLLHRHLDSLERETVLTRIKRFMQTFCFLRKKRSK